MPGWLTAFAWLSMLAATLVLVVLIAKLAQQGARLAGSLERLADDIEPMTRAAKADAERASERASRLSLPERSGRRRRRR